MPLNLESGLKGFRAEFVAETTTGVAPANPTWLAFSDGLISISVATDASITPLRFLGDADVQDFIYGSEDASMVVTYAFHDRVLTADLLEDAITRDADNNLSSSYTVVVRESRTLSVGADSAGSRVYTVGLGGFVTGYTLGGELDPPTPLQAAATITFEKIRSYKIDQPSAASDLYAKSSNASDTTQNVTVENDGAGVSQSVQLNGTTAVSLGASTYTTIDSISLDAECIGDVVVGINDAAHPSVTEGVVLCTIRGSAYYDNSEGDLGVPPLGSGSHASAIGGSYATLSGSTIQWNSAALADVVVSSVELSVGNMVGGQLLSTAGTRRKKILVGGTEYALSAQVVGEFASHENIDDQLGGTAANATFQVGAAGANKTITLSGAVKSESGGRQYDQSGAMVLNTTLMGKSAAIS